MEKTGDMQYNSKMRSRNIKKSRHLKMSMPSKFFTYNVDNEVKDIEAAIKDKCIIHIAGTTGVGKTTLGRFLHNKFGKRMAYQELDEINSWRSSEFIRTLKWKTEAERKSRWLEIFQLNVDIFIAENLDKDIILFTGYADSEWGEDELPEYVFVNLHAKYRFFLEEKNAVLVAKRGIKRDIKFLCNNKVMQEEILNGNVDLQLSLKQRLYQSEMDKKIYVDVNGYLPLSKEEITERIDQIAAQV